MKKFLFFLLLLASSELNAQNWIVRQTPITSSLTAVKFIDANTGWIGAYNGAMARTTNGGLNWDQYTSPVNNIINTFEFSDVATGWFGGAYSNELNKTTNAGIFWFNQWSSSNVFPDTVTSIQFINSQTGWFNTYRYVFKTTNGGVNWNSIYQIPYSYSNYITNITFLNELTGYITKTGQVLKTVNGGVNWTEILNFPYYYFLPQGQIINSLKAWILINGNTLRKTTDGSNWTQISLTGLLANKIKFFGSDIGFLINYNGSVYKTFDAGNNWQILSLGGPYVALNMNFINEQTGWLSCENGRILKTTTGGITYVASGNSEIPDNFSLSQNYPNPFNPTTTINYELPVTNFVSIKVYDVLGNEVETLVNEKQNAGSYSVGFNAAELPSGIYFYKLVTEKFSETKKMILVK